MKLKITFARLKPSIKSETVEISSHAPAEVNSPLLMFGAVTTHSILSFRYFRKKSPEYQQQGFSTHVLTFCWCMCFYFFSYVWRKLSLNMKFIRTSKKKDRTSLDGNVLTKSDWIKLTCVASISGFFSWKKNSAKRRKTPSLRRKTHRNVC